MDVSLRISCSRVHHNALKTKGYSNIFVVWMLLIMLRFAYDVVLALVGGDRILVKPVRFTKAAPESSR